MHLSPSLSPYLSLSLFFLSSLLLSLSKVSKIFMHNLLKWIIPRLCGFLCTRGLYPLFAVDFAEDVLTDLVLCQIWKEKEWTYENIVSNIFAVAIPSACFGSVQYFLQHFGASSLNSWGRVFTSVLRESRWGTGPGRHPAAHASEPLEAVALS